jgi:uncharacterized membrane protein HdeD (DUF308 family)
MEAIEKKLNGFLGAAIGTTLVMTAIGAFFFIFPGVMLAIMQTVISLLLIAAGIILIARDMQSGKIFSLFSTSLMGIFLVIMGIVIAIYPQTLYLITIAFGVYMILNSVMQLNLASQIRGTKAYNVALVTNVIGLICGVIMIVHPGGTDEVIIMVAGAVLMVYGISGLIDTFILKSKIDKVKDAFKGAAKATKKKSEKLLEDANEAEIVEDDDKKDSKKKPEK